MHHRTITRRACSITAIALSGLCLTLVACTSSKSQRIGNPDEGIGGRCKQMNFNAVPNRTGFVAQARTAYCPGIGATGGSLGYYVFVRPTAQSNTEHNLVLRYYSANDGKADQPTLRWLGPNRLEITTPRDVQGFIDWRLHDIGKIQIVYRIA
jgi:hypothetical protein